MLTKHEIKEAIFWGEGFCLKCLEKSPSVENNDAQVCDSCGTQAVVAAQMLLNLLNRVEPEDGE